jgi:esterase
VKLYYSRHGQGQPLLLCHGLFGSGDNLSLLSRLFEPDFDVINVDLRNHGRSPHDPNMTYAAMASDLLELLNALELPQASLLGHSLGGKAVMRLALDQPGRVSRLIVADMAPKAYDPLHAQVFEALENLDLGELSSRAQADALLTEKIADEPTRGLLLKNLGRNGDGKFIWKMNLKALSMAKKDLGLGLESARPFEGLTCFIKGELSNYVQDSDIPAIKKLFPSMSLVTLSKAGHWLHAEQPEAFAQAAKKFLNSLSRP